jgi:hypothetical protein
MSLCVVKIDRCPQIKQAFQFAEVAGSGGLMEGGHGGGGRSVPPSDVGF